MLPEIISYILLFVYFILIFSFILGFKKLQTYFVNKKINNSENVRISVLIPFKNEAKHLAALISGLKKQTLDKDLYEIFFINDHSEDKSEELLSELISGISNFNILSLQEGKNRKKEAIKEGITNAKNKLIVTSDADCTHPERWLETIFNCYSEFKPKMIIAPVVMNGNNFFGRLQSLDFLSLTASTAGAAGIGRPIMCNGANLVYEKDVFYEFKDALNMKEVSGDDVFLLHNVKKKYPKEIHYLKSKDAVVFTKAEKTFKKFIKQRIRWASKSGSYKDFDTIFVSLTVFLTNLLLISNIFLTLFGILKPELLLILFLIKFTADTLLLSVFGFYFNQKKILSLIPFLSIIHPFYIAFTGITGILKKSNRRINELS